MQDRMAGKTPKRQPLQPLQSFCHHCNRQLPHAERISHLLAGHNCNYRAQHYMLGAISQDLHKALIHPLRESGLVSKPNANACVSRHLAVLETYSTVEVPAQHKEGVRCHTAGKADIRRGAQEQAPVSVANMFCYKVESPVV
eukprot:GHUV01014995.1.p1 GENE.GHUV01014995.1~~GHUV01014995.1.p1  ORF type:complete len:142 (-),score=1.96 GHUV01014995.1:500-925(-)